MLTTNLIKKDILKGTEWESGLALGGLACFMTPDLAQDLTEDIISLMSSTRPYVRKRAVLVSYKLFLHYPEGIIYLLAGNTDHVFSFANGSSTITRKIGRQGARSSSGCCKCHM